MSACWLNSISEARATRRAWARSRSVSASCREVFSPSPSSPNSSRSLGTIKAALLYLIRELSERSPEFLRASAPALDPGASGAVPLHLRPGWAQRLLLPRRFTQRSAPALLLLPLLRPGQRLDTAPAVPRADGLAHARPALLVGAGIGGHGRPAPVARGPHRRSPGSAPLQLAAGPGAARARPGARLQRLWAALGCLDRLG